MQLNPSEISELIKDRIKNFESTAEARTEGTSTASPTSCRAK
jgi:F-type H+-transporting ATPase subunit alpha